jgi:hypothetical protein
MEHNNFECPPHYRRNSFKFVGVYTYSGGQNKVGQCFFTNVNLLALSMVTMKISIYLL